MPSGFDPNQIVAVNLQITDGGAQVGFESTVRGFDWTFERDSSGKPFPGDFTVIVANFLIGAHYFERARDERDRLDEVAVRFLNGQSSEVAAYRLREASIVSFRAHDDGGSPPTQFAGLVTLTFDWQQIEVKSGGKVVTYDRAG
jgi:hypothetical protein